MVIKRIDREEEKRAKREKDKFLNRKAFKENKVRWNHEDDNDLSTEEFMKKHDGLIKRMVYDKLRPMRLDVSSQYHDDMLSDAYLRVYTRDQKWEKGKKGGKSRKRWMIMCLNQELYTSANKIRKLMLGSSCLYNEEHSMGGYSSNVDGNTLSLVKEFIDTLDLFQREVFLARLFEEERMKDVAKRWKTRKENVIEEFRYLKEEFLTFAKGRDSSVEIPTFGGADTIDD